MGIDQCGIEVYISRPVESQLEMGLKAFRWDCRSESFEMGGWRNSTRGPRPTVPNSVYATLGPEVYEQMFRSGGQSDAKPSVLSSQASLVLIYRVTEGRKGRVNLAQPWI
ncbi:hypothetical protein TNCV_45611 [Trichonephila clavipes]|nr:hypothetical protein TNCV_45611 [Trichonephila clavipes]